MSDDTIKVSDSTKKELDDIKENYYEYTTLSYSEAVDVLIAEYGGGVQSSDEDEDFLGEEGENDGLTAEEKANRFKVNE